MPVVVEETTKQRHSRLRREYGDLFNDAAPVMMMSGTDDEIYAQVESAIAVGKPLEIEWDPSLDY